MIQFSQLNYGSPEWVWLMGICALFLILYGLLEEYRDKASARFTSTSLLSSLWAAPSSSRRWTKAALLCFAWACAVWALMQPHDEGHYLEEDLFPPMKPPSLSGSQQVTLRKKAHDVIFLLDASESMEVADTRLGKTRFDSAKETIDAILSQLQGENTVLDLFTSQLIPKVPSTLDYLYVHLLSEEATINEGGVAGTDLKKVLETLLEKISEEPGHRHYTVVLLSDGEDTQLSSEQGAPQKKRREEILSTLEKGKNENLRIISIGFGSAAGGVVPNITYGGQPVISKRDEMMMTQIAKATGGDFIDANNETPPHIAAQVKALMKKDRPLFEDNEKAFRNILTSSSADPLIFTPYFQWPLGFAIFFLSLGIGLSEYAR